MKKVWILEKFASREEMVKSYEEMKAMIEHAKASGEYDAKAVESLDAGLVHYEKTMNENPDGRWYGFEGKVRYNEFCYVAKAAIKRNPEGKFRVVEGEIANDAKYWNCYKMTKVNDGVLHYLMATKNNIC